jgi:hypothetical protein
MQKDPETYALRRKFTDVYNDWHIRDIGYEPNYKKVAISISPLIQQLAKVLTIKLKDDLLECETIEDEKKLLDSWAHILNNKDELPLFLQNQLYNLRNLSDYLPQIINTYRQNSNGRKNTSNNISKPRDKATNNQRELTESHYRAILAAISTKGRSIAELAYSLSDIQMAEAWQRNTNSPIISEN